MALTVGAYAWPDHAHAVAVASVVALTAVNYRGVQKSALLTRIVVALGDLPRAPVSRAVAPVSPRRR